MFKKIIIIVFAFFIILLVGSFIFLNFVYIPKNLKPLVTSLLEQTLKKKVSIENAFYLPLKGVTLTTIKIINPDKSPFLEIDEVSLSLKSLPQLQKEGFLAKAKLNVRGIMFSQQKFKFSGNSIIDASVQLKAKNELNYAGTMTLDNMQINGVAPVAEITNINGNISFTQDYFASPNLNALINKQNLNINFEGIYNQSSLTLKSLNLVYGKTNISCRGQIFEFNKPGLNFSADGSLSLEDIKRILSGLPLPVLSGEGKFSAAVEGGLVDIKTIKAQAKLELAQGSFDKIKIAQTLAMISVENGIANLNSLDCNLYEGKIEAKGKAKFTEHQIPLEFSAKIKDINISPLLKDYIGQDIGRGLVSAEAALTGKAMDLTSLTGSGWAKMLEGNIHAPNNFGQLAKILRLEQLSNMEIKEASATFTIKETKIETQDLILLTEAATISGKGYLDFYQYVDFEILIKLSPEFVQSIGGIGQMLSFISDETGAPIAKVKIYDKITGLKYKTVPLPVQEIIKDKIKKEFKEGLKGLFEQIIK